MTLTEATQHVRELSEIRKQIEQLRNKVDRKRSWRESEKVMTKMSYDRKLAALSTAISLISAAGAQRVEAAQKP